jgi:hypothetical protein
MTKRELITALEALPVSDSTEVYAKKLIVVDGRVVEVEVVIANDLFPSAAYIQLS